MFIDGEVYFDRDKDLEERPGKEARKKALANKLKAPEKRERKKPEPTGDKKNEQPGGAQ